MTKLVCRMGGGLFVGLALIGAGGCAFPEEDESAGEETGEVSEAIVQDVIPLCGPEPICDPTLDVQRSSLLLTSATHAKFLQENFALESVLKQVIERAGVTQSPTELFQRIWDTQNESPGVFTEAFQPHCDDDGQTINGFPVDCRPGEGAFAANKPSMFDPIALFNRFDLAPTDGSHCGEYRIVYATPGDDVFMIFEGQLPNPNPACGLEACRPVAELWQSLPSLSPDAMEKSLIDFYYKGIPGFSPVIDAHHYGLDAEIGTPGSSGGQIRTNQFRQAPWQLRELQLGLGCGPVVGPVGTKPACKLFGQPVTVKANPFGDLFDESSTLPQASAFQSDFVTGNVIEALAASTLMGITLTTNGQYDAGQSTAQPSGNDPDDYVAELGSSGPFFDAIDAKLDLMGSALAPEHIAARALTQSCAGCHALSNDQPLGPGLNPLRWPSSIRFFHVQHDGAISAALDTTFLPHREQVLETFLRNCAADPGPSSKTLGGSKTH